MCEIDRLKTPPFRNFGIEEDPIKRRFDERMSFLNVGVTRYNRNNPKIHVPDVAAPEETNPRKNTISSFNSS